MQTANHVRLIMFVWARRLVTQDCHELSRVNLYAVFNTYKKIGLDYFFLLVSFALYKLYVIVLKFDFFFINNFVELIEQSQSVDNSTSFFYYHVNYNVNDIVIY